MNKSLIEKLVITGVLVVVIVTVFNAYSVISMRQQVTERISEAKELAKPARISLLTIKTSCIDCFDIKKVTDAIADAGFSITEQRSIEPTNEEAKALINKYQIQKLPSIIITGEIDKATIQNFNKLDDALIFNGVTAPYENALTNKIEGKVKTIVISDKRCKVCVDYSLIAQSFSQNGIYLESNKQYDLSDTKSQEIISKYGVVKIPAVIISKEIEAYPTALANLQKAGMLQVKDSYIMEPLAPFTDANTGKIRGEIKITLLTDNACEDCYDVKIQEQILRSIGLGITNVSTIDVSSSQGIEITSKYKITSVPTVLLKGDLEPYKGFTKSWLGVGTVEEDDTYVFRDLSQLGRQLTYKDLTTGKTTSTALQVKTSTTV